MKTKNLIIGFGKAGKTLAAEFARCGEGVILVEKSSQMYGGTCINVGCIPSKFLENAAKNGINFADAITKKNTLITALRAKNLEKLENLSGVQIITGTASFLDENHIIVTDDNGQTTEIEAERIFINTGTCPAIPHIDGIEGNHIFDSTGIMNMQKLPENLVIIGAGFIALEFASMFANFGSKVTILNRSETILSDEDENFQKAIVTILEKQGIVMRNATTPTKLLSKDNGVDVVLENETLHADAVLYATGRTPNTEDLSLENAGIMTDKNGYIVTDEHLKTNKNHIFALGDVANSPQFTYISLDDFRIVKSFLFDGGKYNKNHRNMFPTSVFLNVPFSHIGMRERDIDDKNSDIVIKKIPTVAVPKSKILGENDGLLQAIVNKKTGEILGATLLAEESHETINTIVLAMREKIPFSSLRDGIFTHPTMAESFNELFDV